MYAQKGLETLVGYGLFIGMLATGYYYNLTFVQLGLVDLGSRVIGLNEQSVATAMGALALLTCVVALAFGWLMQRRGWSQQLIPKLRLAWAVVLAQTLLTIVAPLLRSEAGFYAWIVVASCALGIGVPATFSLTVDLIPTRHRGYVAALITAAAYLAANLLPADWTIETFSAQMLLIMPAGVVGLGILAWARWPFVQTLATQHNRPAFKYGRYISHDTTGRASLNRGVLGFIVLMFGIYFIDSLGFLRLLASPVYMDSAWQSPDWNIRLFIGGVHVVAAVAGGILYSALDERRLFAWVFGIFALTHLMYTFDIRGAPQPSAPLVMPMLYATAVSLYTVINFAIWADLSTPQTISIHTAWGVALSGWTATFISTALAIQWRLNGLSLAQHLNIVDALAMLFFVALLLTWYFQPGGVKPSQRGQP